MYLKSAIHPIKMGDRKGMDECNKMCIVKPLSNFSLQGFFFKGSTEVNPLIKGLTIRKSLRTTVLDHSELENLMYKLIPKDCFLMRHPTT